MMKLSLDTTTSPAEEPTLLLQQAAADGLTAALQLL